MSFSRDKGQGTLSSTIIVVMLLFVGAFVAKVVIDVRGVNISHELDIYLGINDVGREMNSILASRSGGISGMEISGGFFAAGYEKYPDRMSRLSGTLEKTERFFVISGKEEVRRVRAPPKENGDIVTEIAVPGAGMSPQGTRGAASMGRSG